MSYVILSEVVSDVECLEENSMLLDVNPLEILQMATRARAYLKKEGSFSGCVMLGYDFSMTIHQSDVGFEVTEVPEPEEEDDWPISRWAVDRQRVMISVDEIRAHAFAKGTKSYFESHDLTFVLKDMADRQLRERQCGS